MVSGCGRDIGSSSTPQSQNSEDYRIQQDCVHHGGIASITPEFTHTYGADITANYLVVCKDGSGPWKEVADDARD